MASKNGASGKTMRVPAGSPGGDDAEDGVGPGGSIGGTSGGSIGGANGLNGGAPNGELDRYHVAILAELQREARLSNAELAVRIGLSPAPTWRRVRWLEEQGFITGYRAEIDRRRLGLGVLAFVRVDADRNNGAATKELEEAIRQLPEVIAPHYISGAGTFELEVMATDLDAFSRFSIDTLLNLPNVKDIHTSFSLGEVKAGGALPLGHLKPKG